ncbi:hypothetical protein M9H77_23605 [Catharanthus roseus]|uniref:Uncharacterized protein n=1 Tax=Catharanthus roseus TaxID=4058 RepID=A0ACC0AV14_CATRO|nr:hypothetical protein M9H77_23605 [Catharanthus roseus]
MNSLYGRFGISPKSTKTKIYDENRYKYLLRKPDFIFGELLDENTYVVFYYDEPSLDSWNPMKNVVVQLAAAITASARMYMYPYTSREDSYYTDTDSIVLAHPLPEEIVSPSVLGKFALEDKIIKELFLALKAYYTAQLKVLVYSNSRDQQKTRSAQNGLRNNIKTFS